jgi:hypothetical protein
MRVHACFKNTEHKRLFTREQWKREGRFNLYFLGSESGMRQDVVTFYLCFARQERNGHNLQQKSFGASFGVLVI